MLDTLEGKLEESLNATPFLAKMFFWPEIQTAREAFQESKRLRENYTPTEDWYVAYGQNLNKCFNAAHNAVNSTYSIYDAIGSIPFIGQPICSMIESYVGNAVQQFMPANQPVAQSYQPSAVAPQLNRGSFKLPKRETSLNIVKSVHKLATEAVCMHYEAATNTSADSLRSKIEFMPTAYQNDPSPIRSYFINALESIGSFFSEAFGGSSQYRANT